MISNMPHDLEKRTCCITTDLCPGVITAVCAVPTSGDARPRRGSHAVLAPGTAFVNLICCERRCTHFIIGRDMAGSKSSLTGEDFYGAYEAQETANKHVPPTAGVSVVVAGCRRGQLPLTLSPPVQAYVCWQLWRHEAVLADRALRSTAGTHRS